MIGRVLAGGGGIAPVLAAANVVTPWWLAGGVAAANCVAAYQPKGAASYAASKINLANPGTYDATEGVAPSWDVATGWAFNGSTMYLETGIVPSASDWSFIVQFANSVAVSGWDCCMGCSSTDGVTCHCMIYPRYSTTARGYANGSLVKTVAAGVMTAGNMGFAAQTAYLNGVAEAGAISGWTLGAVAVDVYFGMLHRNATRTDKYKGDIIAAAIYNATLTPAQVAAIAARMAAL